MCLHLYVLYFSFSHDVMQRIQVHTVETVEACLHEVYTVYNTCRKILMILGEKYLILQN